MDIDENTGQGTPPSQPGADVEQFLLHQFSRMGTTDHDELVNQLQKVLGNQLNYNTARFFLDMNNWYVLYRNCTHHSTHAFNFVISLLFLVSMSLFWIRSFVGYRSSCFCFVIAIVYFVTYKSGQCLRLCANVFILNSLFFFPSLGHTFSMSIECFVFEFALYCLFD